jgi:hypothetical protein
MSESIVDQVFSARVVTDMTTSIPILAFTFFLATGCASRPTAQTSTPTAAATEVTPTSTTAKSTEGTEIIAWSSYESSPHFMMGEGRFYQREGQTWMSAWCHVSKVSDPRAGKNSPPTCGAWQTVAAQQATILTGLLRPGYQQIDFQCRKEHALCSSLDAALVGD